MESRVARLELLYFLGLYLVSLPLQLISTSSFLRQGSTALIVFTALHAGVVAALFWCLLGEYTPLLLSCFCFSYFFPAFSIFGILILLLLYVRSIHRPGVWRDGHVTDSICPLRLSDFPLGASIHKARVTPLWICPDLFYTNALFTLISIIPRSLSRPFPSSFIWTTTRSVRSPAATHYNAHCGLPSRNCTAVRLHRYTLRVTVVNMHA